MKKRILLLGIAMIIGVLSACADKPQTSEEPKTYEGDFSYDIQDFEYKNQDEEMVSSEDLNGNFWVADFIFTNCTSACPPMTANMSKLQSELKEAGLSDKVRLVSFTMDPNHDSPKVLKDYAQKFDAEFTNWDLLTGYSQEEIKKLSIESFKAFLKRTEVQDPAEGQPDYNYVHSSSLYIVSPNGKAIKKYNGNTMDPSVVENMVKDLKGYIQ